ncbi:hypothetical protein [Psittacicella gerlachiana]|uniref:Uncharacterized protein n=1 Tax=Psittacicella gerlachiana TaxID=2028574 RepID=A0A3A1YHP8_9GAMM|nr:hypothetical protein [Psittacicella gerlachiana]RIY36769.1 hypothetical protein CKF59_02325 [Psittacicella gerlachiana]
MKGIEDLDKCFDLPVEDSELINESCCRNFSFKVENEVNNDYCYSYRDLKVPRSLISTSSSFKKEAVYILDGLSKSEFEFIDNIVTKRMMPTNDSERKFLLVNIFRYYFNKAHSVFEHERNMSIRYSFIKLVVYALLCENNIEFDFENDCTITYTSSLLKSKSFVAVGLIDYKEMPIGEITASKAQAKAITSNRFYQEFGFHLYKDLEEPNTYIVLPYEFLEALDNNCKLKSLVDSLGLDLELLAYELKSRDNTIFFNELNEQREISPILFKIDDLSSPTNLKVKDWFVQTLKKLVDIQIKAPLCSYGLCNSEAGLFLMIPLENLKNFYSKELNCQIDLKQKLEYELSVISLNYEYLDTKGWGLFTKSLVHEFSHWLDYAMQSLYLQIFPEELYNIDHSDNFFTLSLMLDNYSATTKDAELNHIINTLALKSESSLPKVNCEAKWVLRVDGSKCPRSTFNYRADGYYFPYNYSKFFQEVGVNFTKYEIGFRKNKKDLIIILGLDVVFKKDNDLIFLSHNLVDVRRDRSYSYKLLALKT